MQDQNRPEQSQESISYDLPGPPAFTKYREQKWLVRLTVSRDTLDIIEHYYPAIKEHVPLRLLLQYILFSRRAISLNSEWDGEGTPLCGKMLAWMAGRLPQFRNRNFVVRDVLIWARDALFDGKFGWADHVWRPDPKKSRCRHLEYVEIHPVVLKTVEEELSRPISEVRDRVYFDTGEPFSRQEAADLRTTSRDIVENLSLSALDEKGNPDVPRKIQAYLNDLPPHGFSQARKKYIAKAYEAVASMPSATEREKRSQSNALMMLRHIDEAPKPLYEVRRNTHRLFAPGSLQGLNRNIRAILTQDWINLDLKSAHLAICARLWGVDSLQDFLSSGESIWDVLIDHMEGALQKQAIKEILYALTYGAGVYWTAYGKQKPRLLKIFEQWGLSAKEAKKARKNS